jgi:chromosome segregation ATPase
MEEKFNISSILGAVQDLNNKRRKNQKDLKEPLDLKIVPEEEKKLSLPISNTDIPPDVDRMILEAEQHLKQPKQINIETDHRFLELQKVNELLNNEKNITNNEISNLKAEIIGLKNQILSVDEKNKQLLDLNKNSIRDFEFYKENYEKLIISNNDLKVRLENVKEQVNNYESIRQELSVAINNLNNILSKSSVITGIQPKNKQTFSENPNIQNIRSDSEE